MEMQKAVIVLQALSYDHDVKMGDYIYRLVSGQLFYVNDDPQDEDKLFEDDMTVTDFITEANTLSDEKAVYWAAIGMIDGLRLMEKALKEDQL